MAGYFDFLPKWKRKLIMENKWLGEGFTSGVIDNKKFLENLSLLSEELLKNGFTKEELNKVREEVEKGPVARSVSQYSKIGPVGVHVLGKSDPRLLTKEEFENSPELLFHGTPRHSEFLPNFDYRSKEYLTENDGSATLGFGLYTIEDKAKAEHYSLVRQSGGNKMPFVWAVLPYQARVLDLRRRDNLSKNAPVAMDFAGKWKERFLQYYRIKKPREGNIGMIIDSLEVKYAAYLEHVMVLDEIDLRVLLGTAPCPKIEISMNLPAPPWTMFFSEFMLEQGFDGIVYNEGGERGGGTGATFIFYNLKKIGTYDSWHKG
ncbi:MAG: hypothetical protein Q7J54_04585 [Candidatus Woesearchaeota archaeon]|nr:hypothetical protein [Candidatus Woesearchaeota archaeon]